MLEELQQQQRVDQYRQQREDELREAADLSSASFSSSSGAAFAAESGAGTLLPANTTSGIAGAGAAALSSPSVVGLGSVSMNLDTDIDIDIDIDMDIDTPSAAPELPLSQMEQAAMDGRVFIVDAAEAFGLNSDAANDAVNDVTAEARSSDEGQSDSRAEQERAEQQDKPTAAERFAETNARLRQATETLLQVSQLGGPVNIEALLDEHV